MESSRVTVDSVREAWRSAVNQSAACAIVEKSPQIALVLWALALAQCRSELRDAPPGESCPPQIGNGSHDFGRAWQSWDDVVAATEQCRADVFGRARLFSVWLAFVRWTAALKTHGRGISSELEMGVFANESLKRECVGRAVAVSASVAVKLLKATAPQPPQVARALAQMRTWADDDAGQWPGLRGSAIVRALAAQPQTAAHLAHIVALGPPNCSIAALALLTVDPRITAQTPAGLWPRVLAGVSRHLDAWPPAKQAPGAFLGLGLFVRHFLHRSSLDSTSPAAPTTRETVRFLVRLLERLVDGIPPVAQLAAFSDSGRVLEVLSERRRLCRALVCVLVALGHYRSSLEQSAAIQPRIRALVARLAIGLVRGVEASGLNGKLPQEQQRALADAGRALALALALVDAGGPSVGVFGILHVLFEPSKWRAFSCILGNDGPKEADAEPAPANGDAPVVLRGLNGNVRHVAPSKALDEEGDELQTALASWSDSQSASLSFERFGETAEKKRKRHNDLEPAFALAPGLLARTASSIKPEAAALVPVELWEQLARSARAILRGGGASGNAFARGAAILPLLELALEHMAEARWARLAAQVAQVVELAWSASRPGGMHEHLLRGAAAQVASLGWARCMFLGFVVWREPTAAVSSLVGFDGWHTTETDITDCSENVHGLFVQTVALLECVDGRSGTNVGETHDYSYHARVQQLLGSRLLFTFLVHAFKHEGAEVGVTLVAATLKLAGTLLARPSARQRLDHHSRFYEWLTQLVAELAYAPWADGVLWDPRIQSELVRVVQELLPQKRDTTIGAAAGIVHGTVGLWSTSVASRCRAACRTLGDGAALPVIALDAAIGTSLPQKRFLEVPTRAWALLGVFLQNYAAAAQLMRHESFLDPPEGMAEAPQARRDATRPFWARLCMATFQWPEHIYHRPSSELYASICRWVLLAMPSWEFSVAKDNVPRELATFWTGLAGLVDPLKLQQLCDRLGWASKECQRDSIDVAARTHSAWLVAWMFQQTLPETQHSARVDDGLALAAVPPLWELHPVNGTHTLAAQTTALIARGVLVLAALHRGPLWRIFAAPSHSSEHDAQRVLAALAVEDPAAVLSQTAGVAAGRTVELVLETPSAQNVQKESERTTVRVPSEKLLAASNYFQALLGGGFAESGQESIVIQTTSPAGLCRALLHAFGAELPAASDMAPAPERLVDMLQAADQFALMSNGREFASVLARLGVGTVCRSWDRAAAWTVLLWLRQRPELLSELGAAPAFFAAVGPAGGVSYADLPGASPSLLALYLSVWLSLLWHMDYWAHDGDFVSFISDSGVSVGRVGFECLRLVYLL